MSPSDLDAETSPCPATQSCASPMTRETDRRTRLASHPPSNATTALFVSARDRRLAVDERCSRRRRVVPSRRRTPRRRPARRARSSVSPPGPSSPTLTSSPRAERDPHEALARSWPSAPRWARASSALGETCTSVWMPRGPIVVDLVERAAVARGDDDGTPGFVVAHERREPLLEALVPSCGPKSPPTLRLTTAGMPESHRAARSKTKRVGVEQMSASREPGRRRRRGDDERRVGRDARRTRGVLPLHRARRCPPRSSATCVPWPSRDRRRASSEQRAARSSRRCPRRSKTAQGDLRRICRSRTLLLELRMRARRGLRRATASIQATRVLPVRVAEIRVRDVEPRVDDADDDALARPEPGRRRGTRRRASTCSTRRAAAGAAARRRARARDAPPRTRRARRARGAIAPMPGATGKSPTDARVRARRQHRRDGDAPRRDRRADALRLGDVEQPHERAPRARLGARASGGERARASADGERLDERSSASGHARAAQRMASDRRDDVLLARAAPRACRRSARSGARARGAARCVGHDRVDRRARSRASRDRCPRGTRRAASRRSASRSGPAGTSWILL